VGNPLGPIGTIIGWDPEPMPDYIKGGSIVFTDSNIYMTDRGAQCCTCQSAGFCGIPSDPNPLLNGCRPHQSANNKNKCK